MLLWFIVLLAGVGAIAWGAEAFAEHLGKAAVALGVSSFALALLLAGAEPEELATAVVASLRGSPGVALGDVIGANVTICLIALGVGALIAPLPFSGSALRYALLGVPLGAIGTWFAWDGNVSRPKGRSRRNRGSTRPPQWFETGRPRLNIRPFGHCGDGGRSDVAC